MITRIESPDETVEVILRLRLSGRAVRDAALYMRRGPEETAKALIEIGKHMLNSRSTERGEIVDVKVGT